MDEHNSHYNHTLLVYDSDDQMVNVVAPYLEAGLAAGEPTLAVLNRPNWAILREALGAAADRVGYTDCDSFYTRPIAALAAYDAALRGHAAAGAPPVRVVGELPWGPTEREWREWMGYEALLNASLSHHAANVLCSYDARVLPDRLVDAALRTHPRTDGNPEQHANHRYESPEDVLRSLAMPPVEIVPPPALELTDDLGVFRERLCAALVAADVPDRRALDALLAASELFTNAWMHGGGATALAAGITGGWFVFQVSDDGPGIDDPLAGYLPPGRKPGAGTGLWVTRQLVSRLELIPREPGLTARFWL
jgi:anti-sigma regulatory factor (Ser/Thr protein kinase)